MIYAVIIAFLGGVLVTISRAINARLSQLSSPFFSSLANHVVGFLFLIPIVAIFCTRQDWQDLAQTPPIYFVGGLLGMLFVLINSWSFPLIGASRTVVLVIAGQTLAGLLLDAQHGAIKSWPLAALGAVCIIFGISIPKDKT